MAGLKVVALISGGKDSLFSILHCIANGHDVVALANLHPPLSTGQDAIEDTDSFMYQTIGHAVIPLYERALGIPLYRQEIVGSAVNQNKWYGPGGVREGVGEDETESLVPLLRKVMTAHPEVNAVSTGAILSDYQRTRVESVALRLGLAPLSYLWQWPTLPPHTQDSLLVDMAAVGQDSRIIKVASGGLDEGALWLNVADTRTIARLTKATERFGTYGDGAVLGEGGEYETLAVQGPTPLWKARVDIGDEERQITPGEAGSFALRLNAPRLAKPNAPQGDIRNLRIPPLLDGPMSAALQKLIAAATPSTSMALKGRPQADDEEYVMAQAPGTDNFLYSHRTGRGVDAAAQTRSIMDELRDELTPTQLSVAAYTSIVLRNMADFASVNEVYGSYFTEPNPPARITLACVDVLPHGCDVLIGMTASSASTTGGDSSRLGLHVQSRSYWAPANIGPYSQAVTIKPACGSDDEEGGIGYVAGRIPLEPASMGLSHADDDDLRSKFAHQTVLALQHMERIGHAVHVTDWVAAIAFIAVAAEDVYEIARMAVESWQTLHLAPQEVEEDSEEDESFDVWHVSHGRSEKSKQSTCKGFRPMKSAGDGRPPPLWVISVDALPKAASVEWVGYGTTKHGPTAEDISHLQYLLHTFRERIVRQPSGCAWYF